MDLEAVNSKLAEIEAEQAEAAASAPAEASVWDKINDTLSGIVSGDAIRQALGETYSDGTDMMPAYTHELPKIEDVAGDVVDAAASFDGKYNDFIHAGANLQQAALEGQASGDYSALNAAVQETQQAGQNFTDSLAHLAASPVRQNARAFIRNNADDDDSPFQSAAQSLQKTDLAISYFTTDAERAQKAREIEEATGIPAEAILHDNDTYRAALDVYEVKKKNEDMEFVWAAYPEIKNVADMDPEAAVIALHDIESVKGTHGVVDTFMHFLEKGSLDLEYNNLQYKIMTGEATDEDRARADEIDKQLKADRREAPGFFQAPLESMAAGVAQSLPEMGQGLKEGGGASLAATTAAVAFTVISGGTDLLAAGAVMGARTLIMRALASQAVKNVAKAGFAVGMTQGMGKPESGRRFAEMGEEKKQDGSSLYTDDERRLYATAGGYANALIETMNVGLGAKALGLYPVAEKVFAQNVEKIVAQTTGRETLRMLATDKLGDLAKLTLTESGEEFLQSVADDLITNAARESKGAEAAHLGTYSASDILRRGASSFIESLPGSMGFGLAGVSVGAVTGVGRLARARKRAYSIETEAERQQQETYTGAMLVEQLQHQVKESKMQKVAPDVQAKVLREQLKDTGFENSYIDVEMALRNEHGREDLQKVADAQGMSAEELEAAISVNGFIPVSTETLCQVEASPELLETVSFSPEAESMARMQENARLIADEYSKSFEKSLEKQQKLIDTVVDKYIPGASAEQKEALRAAVLANPQNPAQGWNVLYKEYQQELQDVIGPALKALEAGMGNAGIMDVKDEQGNTKTVRYTENDEWYRNFYQQFKRRPTKQELQDMAIAMTIGDQSAPRVAGWVPDSEEMQLELAQNKETIETLQQRLAELESIKGETKKLTGVEMEITEGLTPEGYKVYRAISNWTKKAGGKIARQGRMAAVLTARHADIVADIVRRKTGKPYTAEDYIREKVGFQLVESGKDFDIQLQQMAGERAANGARRQIIIDGKRYKSLMGGEDVEVDDKIISNRGINYAIRALETNGTLEGALAELEEDSNSFMKGLARQAKEGLEWLRGKEVSFETVEPPKKVTPKAAPMPTTEEEIQREVIRTIYGPFTGEGYNPRSLVPKVRGGWTEKKIIKYLKEHGTPNGVREAVNLISEFENVEELKAHMFFHGSPGGASVLKPSITMSEKQAEKIGGGGYGERYWGISVTPSKKVASNFSGEYGRQVNIYPLILAKNAIVEEAPQFEDAADIAPHIVDYWTRGVDAVWIGDKNAGEQELLILNPRAVVNIGRSDTYDVFGLGTDRNPLNIKSDDEIAKMLDVAKSLKNKEEGFSYTSPETRAAIFFQRAWHGSPYDFANFDLGAIGSGEGAQVHGWGLYFAANREVSEGYRERLALDSNEVIIDGETYFYNQEGDFEKRGTGEVIEYGTPLRMAVGYFSTSEGKVKDAIESLQKDIKEATPKKLERWGETWNKAIDILEKEGESWAYKGAKGGKLFQVEIPDDDVLLDEQKSFNEQPEKVQKALKNFLSKYAKSYHYKKEGDEYVVYDGDRQVDVYDWEEDAQTSVEENNEAVQDSIDSAFRGGIESLTGRKIYGGMTRLMHGDKQASEKLNDIGIKGITYEGGQDGRCFVVFDDKAISVINKFNQQNEDFAIKGGIAPDPQEAGRKIISLLETADESTFMHEMAHLFLFDLEDLARIDDISAKELDIVNQWAEWKPGASTEYKGTAWEEEFARREQAIIDAEAYGLYDEVDRLKYEWKQERFARAFEMYLKDGQAPARGLRAVFRKFKQFLRVIYQAFVGDGGKASEPVRRVMDRMIATEDEIEAAALEDRYSDVQKAGGENLFSESEQETLARWLDEEKEAAKENVSKMVMKDLEKEKQTEFDRELAKEKERYTKELQQEDVHVARRAVEISGGDKSIVTEWFDSVEAYEWADKNTPSLDSLVNDHMADYAVKLDQQLIESHLSREAVAKAMDSANYRQKIETYVLRGMEKKKSLINRINTKAKRALDSIEEKLQALPEDVDMKLEKDNPTVKDVMKEINRLRFAGKWTTSDINHIEAMLRANTQEQVRAAIKELKTKQQKKAQQEKDIKEATKGYEQFIREQVKKVTESQPMTETCNVRYYQDKERACGRRVQAMLKAGNWDMAVQQQRQKVFYSEMIKQARENREARDKMVRDLEKKSKAKSVRLPKDERYWFNHLLYCMRIAKTDIKEPEGGARKLDQLFQEHVDNLDMMYTPTALLDIADKGENFGDFQQLSLQEFKDVYDDLKRLYIIGRDKFRLKTIAGKDIEEVLQEIISEEGTISDDISTVVRKITPDSGGLGYLESLGGLGTMGDDLAKSIQQYQESILKPENLIKMLGKKAHKYIFGTLDKAAEKEAKLSADNLEALRKINGIYSHKEREGWSKKIYDFSPAKGNKISKEQIICMALNWGTKVNQQRLLGGLIADEDLKTDQNEEKVRQELFQLFSRTMTKKDWEFVQALWDHLDTFWPETAATEEKLNGVALEKVAASSFEITTADGENIKLRGGYMHIKYDPNKSARAEEQEIEDAARSMMGAARMGTGRSFTKGRSEYNIYRPLQLDFSVITQHIQEVIHNIAFRVPLRDVYRLLHYNNFKSGVSMEEHLRRTLGVEAYRVLDQWALDAWKRIDENRNVADTSMKKLSRWLRGNSTMAIMGYNIWACVENISNIPIGMHQLGAGKMLAALVDFYSHPEENMRTVRNLSIFMRSRAENLDRDLRSQPGVFNADNKFFEIVRNHSYDLMVWSDLMTSGPIWYKSYKDAFEPKLREVKKENDENIQQRLELSAKVDAINGQISDNLAASEAIDKFMQVRRYGTPEEVAALSDSPYTGQGEGELRAQWGEHQKEARRLRRDLWKAEMDLQKAMELPVYDEAEMVEEAKNRAALEADGAIRDTFGSGRNIDLPAVQRSRNEFVQLFTAFYGFFNTQYNALYMAYMGSRHLPSESHILKWAPFAKAIMYRVVLSSLIGSSLAFALGLKGDNKDDKEKTITKEDGTKEKVEIPAQERFLKVWAQNALSTSVGGLYGFRDLAGIIGEWIISGNARDYGLGSVVTRSASEGMKVIQLLGKKGAKDAEIQAQQEKKQKEHEEKLRKYKGKKRQEYLKKWEEEQKYKKPPARITYPEILGHAAKGASAATAAYTGITGTLTNSITATMQYLMDQDARYDPTIKNILWSAIFNKKPVEREIPKKPETPKEDKKKKKKS